MAQNHKGFSRLTPMDASIEFHRREVENVYSWLSNITMDAFGGE